MLKRDFRRIDPTSAQIILIEASPRILSQFSPALSRKAQSNLEKFGVQVRTSCAVQAAAKGCITLANNEVIQAGTIVWAAGILADPLTRRMGVALDRQGRVKVAPDLSLPGHPEVFAIGDIAMVLQNNGTPVPAVAPAAMQMARYVARHLRHKLQTRDATTAQPAFHYHDKGSLATIGRSAAIAQFRKIEFDGFPAWIAWLSVHLIFLIGFRNKLAVLISWIYSYFTYKSGARIITNAPQGAGEIVAPLAAKRSANKLPKAA